jgi:hypothetical protein
MKYIYYFSIFLFFFFDQLPSYPEDVYQSTTVITPWIPIPLLRITTIELLIIVLFLYVVLAKTKKTFQYLDNRILKSHLFLLCILIQGIIFGVFYNGFITEVFFQSRGLIQAILFFFVVLFFTRDPKTRETSIKIFAIACCFKALEGICFFCFGNLGLTTPDGAEIIFYDQTTNIQLLAIIFLGLFNYKNLSFYKKTLFFLISIFSLISFIFSFRRNFYIALVVVLLLLLIKYSKNGFRSIFKLKRVFGFLVIIVMIFTVLSYVLPQTVIDNYSERLASTFTIDDSQEVSAGSNLFRIMELSVVLENYKLKPIFGAGLGGRYNLNLSPFPLVPVVEIFMEKYNNYVHDSYLAVLYKMGLVGFIFFIISIVLNQSQVSEHFFIKDDYSIIKVTYVISVLIIVSNLLHPNIFWERIISIPSIFFALSLNTINSNLEKQKTVL